MQPLQASNHKHHLKVPDKMDILVYFCYTGFNYNVCFCLIFFSYQKGKLQKGNFSLPKMEKLNHKVGTHLKFFTKIGQLATS